jgi:hypothetical protein
MGAGNGLAPTVGARQFRSFLVFLAGRGRRRCPSLYIVRQRLSDGGLPRSSHNFRRCCRAGRLGGPLACRRAGRRELLNPSKARRSGFGSRGGSGLNRLDEGEQLGSVNEADGFVGRELPGVALLMEAVA